jgi:hypothetical protein
MRQLIERLRILATGRCEWVNDDGTDAETTYEPWSIRWTIAGVHLPRRWQQRLGLVRTVDRASLDWGDE